MEHFFTYPADTPPNDLKNDRPNKEYIESAIAADAAHDDADANQPQVDEAPATVPNQGAY